LADIASFADELGPAKVIQVYEPTIGLRAVLVVDNIAAGPALGGVRLDPGVSVEECFRLARAMTLKNAAAELAYGGGKIVIYGDPKMPKPEKERLIRALACALRDERDYIFAPDMGTDEECMAWVKDEIGRVVGLPRVVGGIPLDEIGATGWGLCQAAEVALPFCRGLGKATLAGVRMVVQGFGAVGKNAARFMADKDAVLVGVSDTGGAIYHPEGLPVDRLIEWKKAGHSVADYPQGKKFDREAVIDFAADIFIPAARPDVLREDNVHRLKVKLVVSGANIPATPGAEQYLHEKGVICLPDFIANAGGVICAALEYQGACECMVFEAITGKIRQNTCSVLEESARRQILPRQAAVNLAVQRVKQAMTYKRWSIF